MSRAHTFSLQVAALLLAAGFMPSAAQSQDGTWSALGAGDPAPSPRWDYAAIYDDVGQRYVLFGGETNGNIGATRLNDVWTLSLSGTPTWTQLLISGPAPGERKLAQWGYDPARNRLLVFGGYGSHYPGGPNEYLDDVWQLSLGGTPQWTELIPAGRAPSGRIAGAAVYDPLRQRLVGFGGTIGQPVDTWSLDLRGQPAWAIVPTDSTSPSGGYGMTSIYDSVRDRMIIFGGSTSDDYYGARDDVWELDLHDRPTWRPLAPAGPAPAPRRSGTAIYDPLRDRMIICGGWDGTSNDLSTFLSDVWALPFSGPLQWVQLSPDGILPAGRDAMKAAYDPLGGRMVFYGGWSGVAKLGDTEFLGWCGLGVSASLVPSNHADPGVAHVEWSVQNATGTHAAVYRRGGGGEWTSLATVECDAAGTVAYDDSTVGGGGPYGYLVVVASERGETFGGETWVDVPGVAGVGPASAPSLALNRIVPNPALARLDVAYSLASAQPARLELIDLAGRRVLARDVGSLGAGAHHLEIDARRFSPGMYFVRLTQSGQSTTSRVVIRGEPGP